MTISLEELTKISGEAQAESRRQMMSNVEEQLLWAAKKGLKELIIWEIPSNEINKHVLSGFSEVLFNYCHSKNWDPEITISDKSGRGTIYNLTISW